MLKKVLGYGIVGLLAIVLIVGTVFIVLRPSSTRAAQGRGDASATESGSGLASEAALGNGQGQERGRTQTDEPETGYRGGGERLGSATGGGTLSATGEWETLHGIVTVADADVTLNTASGDVVIGMGPAHYREEAGFTVNVGDEITVSGYLEDDEFKAGTVENHATGKTIVLRDETGRPMWAGKGNLRNQQP